MKVRSHALPITAITLFAAACADSGTATSPLALKPGMGPQLQVIAGNATCSQLTKGQFPYEIKVDPPKSGSYGPITATFSDGGKLLAFTSTVPVQAVFVKGGNVGGFLYWTPEGYPKSNDSNMSVEGYVPPATPQNAISHVSFCWAEKPDTPREALAVSKTVLTAYEKDITWDLTKSVDPTSHTGNAGEVAGTSIWTIGATKNLSAPKNFKVTGLITITNPELNGVSVNVEVSDKLDDGTLATIFCPSNAATPNNTGSIAAGTALVCRYESSPTSMSATLNNAQVSVTNSSTIPGNTDQQPVDWTKALVTENGDAKVTLADDRKIFGEPASSYSQEISGSTSLTPSEKFSCPADASLYKDGIYKYTEKNTATLKGDKTDITKDATVDVTCTLSALKIAKTAAGAYDRTITWDLVKSVDPTSHTGVIGEVAGTSTWSVKATKTETLGNYKVTGKITITNPGIFSRTFTVKDKMDDGTEAAVNCLAFTVAPGQSVECSYEAAPTGKSATINTATVTAAGNPDQTANADVKWTEKLIGDDKVTLADPRPIFNYSQVIEGTTPLTKPETFSCPADASKYSNGKLTYSEKNTATLKGSVTDLSKDATVTITCTNPYKGETATGRGFAWSATGGTSNWFMYTPWVNPTSISGGKNKPAIVKAGLFDVVTSTASTVDLIAGQFYDVGDITGLLSSDGQRSITIKLTDQAKFASVASNVKIHPLTSCESSINYVQPGQYSIKQSASGGTITVDVPSTIGKQAVVCYAIHVDVLRYVP